MQDVSGKMVEILIHGRLLECIKYNGALLAIFRYRWSILPSPKLFSLVPNKTRGKYIKRDLIYGIQNDSVEKSLTLSYGKLFESVVIKMPITASMNTSQFKFSTRTENSQLNSSQIYVSNCDLTESEID